jgi:dTDP-4-amino-4,6-dideoxygalactose transaminase
MTEQGSELSHAWKAYNDALNQVRAAERLEDAHARECAWHMDTIVRHDGDAVELEAIMHGVRRANAAWLVAVAATREVQKTYDNARADWMRSRDAHGTVIA